MAKYDKDTKFYWLQLKEDFFEDDAIEWLEEQKPNGRDYAYFYLKLCLKSLKSNGVLVRKVGEILIPYNNEKLAEITKMDFDTVTVAMELLKQIGLIKILENGEIYMAQLENLIGSTSKGAFKKQLQIARRKEEIQQPGWNEGGKISTKDKDKDKDIDINKYILPHFEKFWKVYPKKVSKQDAYKWFLKNNPSDETVELMIKQIERFKDTEEWKREKGQFIPYPASWLNGHRWEDEFETEKERDERIQKEIENDIF